MSTKTSTPPVVMVIGGMDPSGGAGLCADIQTLSMLGCHAAPVVTAVTVQDTSSVTGYELVEPEVIRAQVQTVLDDIYPVVIKTGMLVNKEVILVLVEALSNYPEISLIVDPVMSSNMNDALSEHSLIKSIKDDLLPLASLLTPNIPEAIALAGMDTMDSADTCADVIWKANRNCDCLITGTHAESEQVTNRYYRQGKKSREWRWQRLPHEYHGSGCTLASACAAGLAHGLSMEQAIDQAQQHVMESLSAAFKPGKGQYLPYRLCPNLTVEAR